VFLDKAKGKKPDSIWRKIERPALKNNPDVGKIIYHWV